MKNIIYHKVSDIAKVLQLSERRVQQLVKEGILPDSKEGKYNLAACIRAYERYLQEKKPQSFERDEIKEQKLRLLKAQAEKAELELEVLKDKYMEVSEVMFEWSNLVLAFRSKMLSLPSKLVRPLAAAGGNFAQLEKIVEDEIYEALTELSKHDEKESDYQVHQEQISTPA